MSNRAVAAEKAIIAVDLGGTRFRVAAISTSGKILQRVAKPTRVEEGVESILERIYATVRSVTAAAGSPIGGLGIAAPGPLNPWTGVLYSPPNMPGWDEVHLKERFEDALKLPVSVGNDANVAALGEHRFGAGVGLSDVVYFTVSTGIGGGIICANCLLVGTDGLAGEVGHMTIRPDGPLCGCGNRGCLEALSSGTSIARQMRELVAQGVQSSALEMAGGDIGKINAELVAAAARAGDPLAANVLRDAAENLGIGVANVVHLFNPQMVIIGGGVANLGKLLFDPVWEVVNQRTMAVFSTRLQIVPAKLEDDAGLLGCVALALANKARARS